MNQLVVPSSPNWFNVNILTCAPDNTLIYGSKSDLLVFHQTPKDVPHQIKYFIKAHNSKVTSVDVNPQWGAPNKWCISSGENGEVKLWDIQEHCRISSHDAHKDQKDKLVGAKFLSDDRVFSVSEHGNMFIWHPSTNEYNRVKNFFVSKVNITCFSPCPHSTNLTAFGLKNGLIVVANLKKNGGVVHNLRGHIYEIVSLTWCPAPFNVFPSKSNNIKDSTLPEPKVGENVDTNGDLEQTDESKVEDEINQTGCDENDTKSNKEEYLLASSAKDLSVNIWRAGTDGRLQCCLRTPKENTYKRIQKGSKETQWTSAKWITPFTLINATSNGNVLKYTLPEMTPSVIHKDHNSFVFTITAHTPVYTAENSLDDTTFWTFGHDMLLLNTNLKTGEHLTRFETLSTVVLCMTPSPLDPHRIALGLSNGDVKIWNTSETHVKSFRTVTYSLKIFSKIVYLTWHPSNELILAFCTEEGTIGLININNRYKATWFKQYFSSKVHRIEWGPSVNNADKMVLYASAGSELITFDPDVPKKEAVKIELPDNLNVYSFAWKFDYSMVLIQDVTGKLVFFNNDFTTLATFHQRKKVGLISWHPDSDRNLERNHWVAATIENIAYVFNFHNMKNGVCNIDTVLMSTLEAHQGKIRSLAWTPFKDNYFVTAGEDGLAFVWNVTTSEIVSSYHSEKFEPIKYIIWSPIHEDILITSNVKASLVLWNKSDYPAVLDEKILQECKQHMKTPDLKSILTKSQTESKKSSKKTVKTSVLPSLNVGNNSEEKVRILNELLEWKERNFEKPTTNGFSKTLQLFGTKDDIQNLLSEKENSHKENKRFEESYMVSFWKGTLADSIQEAIDLRRVTPTLMLLAPTISLSLWQRACETYAEQLEQKEDSEPLEIASYYLACQNIEKAIECLCERDMYKEALTLAKCRLPEDNIFVDSILKKWANYAVYCGAMETAAQCYIILQQYEEAVKVLFRREDPEILSFALNLAKKINNEELIKAVEFRCQAFAKNGTEESVGNEQQ